MARAVERVLGPNSAAPIAVPVADPISPISTVSQNGIGSGPGTAKRAALADHEAGHQSPRARSEHDAHGCSVPGPGRSARERGDDVERAAHAGEVDRARAAVERAGGGRSRARPGPRRRREAAGAGAAWAAGAGTGRSTVPTSLLPSRWRSYVSAPKLVGAALTAIRLAVRRARAAASRRRGRGRPGCRPGRAARGRASAAASRGTPSCYAVFGGMYIDRYEAPRSGETVAASPETNVFGVIDAPSIP